MGNDNDTFKQVLVELVKTYGPELFRDTRRINALLMDYAPKQVKERKLIIMALDEGVGTELLKVRGEGGQEKQLGINRCVHRLVAESWVTEEAARLAVGMIAHALCFDGGGINAEDEQKRSELGRRLVEVIRRRAEDECQRLEEQRQQEDTTGASHGESSVLQKGNVSPGDANLNTYLKSIRVIGYKALAADTTLKRLEIPEGIRAIRSKAFVDCINLERVSIPATVEEIGNGAFSGCDRLQQIAIEGNPFYTVVNGMLIDKRNQALMRATQSVKGKCRIPGKVTSIQARAFERSNVKEIELPMQLVHLDIDAFTLCGSLQAFYIAPTNGLYSVIDGVLHTRDRSRLARFPSGRRSDNYIMDDAVSHISDGAFSGAAWLKSITFTSSLKSIGARAFEYCMALSSLILPGSIETIGERAFQYCPRLSSVMLPYRIQSIGDFAFSGCSGIQTLSLPKSIKQIGHAAFKGCTSLRRIIIQSNVEFIGDGAFSGCAKDLEISIKDNSYMERYCRAHRIAWTTI